MRWTPGGESSDIEDRRDDSGGEGFGGGGGGFGFGGVHLGIGGTILLIILSLIFRHNLFTMFSGSGDVPVNTTRTARPSADANEIPNEQKEVQLVSFVLDDVQNTWAKLLPEQAHIPYRHAKLVLFRNSTRSACGQAQLATGPFYCPADEKVYLDLGFYEELKTRFGAPGEFAQAYVLAHEIGHHVQKLLGIETKVRRLQQLHPEEVNPLSVRLELQADCFAGIWANTTKERKIIDETDISQGLNAAASVGDDRLQKMATGHVSPENFTHGTSASRMKWFRAGLDSGDLSACKTFAH
jgi:predicted metalloprotease